MVRTQVYLKEEQMIQLRMEAQKQRTKISLIIRKAIDHYFLKKGKMVNWDTDPLSQSIGAIALDVDTAKNHDRYLAEVF